MMKNILPAILTATIRDFKPELIGSALKSFIPSPTVTPGRLNIFHFKNFELMIDYAHNTDGYKELKKFLAHMVLKRSVLLQAPAIEEMKIYETQVIMQRKCLMKLLYVMIKI